jgi:diguanylate cyclase (GGDEF)-like protein
VQRNVVHRKIWLRRASVAGAAALVALSFLPSAVLAAVIVPVLAAPIVASWRCYRRSVQSDRHTYAFLAIALLAINVGNEIALVRDARGAVVDTPSVADGFFVTGYVLLGVALFVLVRSRPRAGDVEGWLDTAIVAVAASVGAWIALVLPVAGTTMATDEKLLQLAYPVALLAISTFIVRIAFAPGRARASDRLLLAAALCGLVSDTVEAVFAGDGSTDVRLENKVLLLLICVFVTAAALHPSAREASAPLPTRGTLPSTRRLIVLSGAVLVAPIAMGYELVEGNRDAMAVLLIATATVCLLVVARLLAVISHTAASALVDPLSRVLNRRGVEQAIRARLDRPTARKAIAVLFVDLDGFKAVNDELGHAGGDEVLARAAERLVATARACDSVGRLGGDEFIVVLPELPADADDALVAVRAAGERFLAAVQEPLIVGGMPVHVSASIGAAILCPYQSFAVSPASLLREADVAMYQAKRAGKGRVQVALVGAPAAAVR